MRAKVEHVFRILKRVFGFDEVRCRASRKSQSAVRDFRPVDFLTASQAAGRARVELRPETAKLTDDRRKQRQSPPR